MGGEAIIPLFTQGSGGGGYYVDMWVAKFSGEDEIIARGQNSCPPKCTPKNTA